MVNNNMYRPLFPLLLSLFCLFSPAYAAEPSARMARAVDKLVESQDLDKMWPAIMEGAAQNGARQVERGARESIDKAADLTPAQRTKAYALIADASPRIAAEINELHRNIAVKALVAEMVYAVYPKYFTPSEIEELANFYSSTAFSKLAHFHIQAGAESARTGKSADVLMEKYLAQLTPHETQSLTAFSSSAIGQKQQKLGPAVAAEGRDYLMNKTRADVEAVAVKHAMLIREKLQRLLQK